MTRYGVAILQIWEKIYYVLMTLHCIHRCIDISGYDSPWLEASEYFPRLQWPCENRWLWSSHDRNHLSATSQSAGHDCWSLSFPWKQKCLTTLRQSWRRQSDRQSGLRCWRPPPEHNTTKKWTYTGLGWCSSRCVIVHYRRGWNVSRC